MAPSQRKIALVTGASAGIGKEIARVLAAQDYDLILVARRTEELTALASELTSAHGIVAHVMTIDLADAAGPGRLAAEVAAKEIEPDVLVNNAGFGVLGPVAEADRSKMLGMVQVNVTALTELTRLFLPGMLKRGSGRILNVGSIAGFQPGPLMAVYYASKAYVNSFSQALANEVSGSGVTVTVLCPGPTKSEFGAVSGMANTRVFKLGTMAGRTVAEAGVRGMHRGRSMVIPGFVNKLTVFSLRFLPRSLVIKVVRWMQATRVRAPRASS